VEEIFGSKRDEVTGEWRRRDNRRVEKIFGSKGDEVTGEWKRRDK
jgi:hypothetical protein